MSHDPRRLWVIEMRIGQCWEPTVGVALAREEGRKKLANWKRRNPNDRFQLVQYIVKGDYR